MKKPIQSPYVKEMKNSANKQKEALLGFIEQLASGEIPQNTFIEGDGFAISMNPTANNGGPETAIVNHNQRPNFLIVNGDHLLYFKPFVKKGYKACVEAFEKLIKAGAERSVWSEDNL